MTLEEICLHCKLTYPQNIVLKHQFARRKQKSQEEAAQLHESGDLHASAESLSAPGDMEGFSHDDKQNHAKRGPRRFLHQLSARRTQRRQERAGRGGGLFDQFTSEKPEASRPAFVGINKSKRYASPREVVVPYSQFRIDRFYDWPPDPTLARATPVVFKDCVIPFQAAPPTASSTHHKKS